MLPINKKSVIVYILIVIAVFLFVFLPDSASKQAGQAKASAALEIQQWETENGVRVLYVFAPELPMLDIQAIFDAGSVRDENQAGIAILTNSLLSHGAMLDGKTLSVDEIAERFENIGARFSANATKDNAKLSLRTLTDESLLTQAVSTMQAIISAPTFNKGELDRIRKQALIGLESRKQSPSTIANELFYKGLYASHPYANPGVGTKESLKALSQKDLINFYKKYYVANNALVTIVGSIDRKKAEQLAQQLVAGLAQGNKAEAIAEVEDLQTATAKHYEFPSTQTHILMGQPGVDRKDKDYFTLYVANHILGGSGFGSRIMEEIREKRGLAYSSYSYFSPMMKRGPFLVGMQTSNKQTEEALSVARETLKKFINEGPTEQELLHAKKNITGGFPLRIDSNRDISNYLAVIGFYNLPLSYLTDFNKKIEAVTLAQIKETIKRRIHPDKMFTVTVGARAN